MHSDFFSIFTENLNKSTMNYFLQKISVLILVLFSMQLFGQKGYYEIEETMPFQPMFSIGSGYYSFQGDIQGPKANVIGGGNIGFNAGMRLNMSQNLDMSLIFSSFELSKTESDAEFDSDLRSIGIHLDYALAGLMKQSRLTPYLSFAAESFSFKTNDYDRESSFFFPVGLGIMLDVSERIKFNIGMNYAITMADIDRASPEKNDAMLITDFTIHYDFFTPKPKTHIPVDESYYNDVNFKAFDIEDGDGDLIPDVDDYCPKTPQGVEVNANGCPLDSDYDGIPNYLDEQEFTPRGAVVNERGVQLTEEQYRSMYSDYASASRRYAAHYNEYKISEDDYKTTNDYLIAKANAFNKAFNEGKKFDNEVKGLRYKVKITSYTGSVPADEMNNLLCLDDLESIPEDNSVVIYAVGSYNSLDDALGREYELEAKGFNETSILVDNNGEVSNYVPVPELEIDEEEEVVAPTIKEIEVEQVVVALSNETIYRIQIGAYKDALPDAVFVGVENVVSFTGKDGLLRYMTGSFVEYKDAVIYMDQMRARGFEDAFIVTYKDGERISLNVAIQTEKEVLKPEALKPSIEFTVQILVAKESLSAADLTKMTQLGNVEKEAEGQEMYRYFAGTYQTLENANIQLEKAKLAGFTDAFVNAKLDGERITLEQAQELLK